MSMFKRHPRVAVAVVSMAVTAGITVPASPAGAVAFTNACKNSVTPNNTQIDVDMTAASPDPVPPGASFGLTNITQTVNVPPSVFVIGYNIGLLQVGQNTIPGATARTVIRGTDTVQGTQTTNTASGPISTTITDPDGIPGGAGPGGADETATPGSLSVSYADQTWTASGPDGSRIQFREETVTPLGLNVGGLIVNASIVGAITLNVQFRCSPGTVTGSEPGVIAFNESAPSFASSAISASAPPPPPPPGPAPPPAPGPVVNNFSFGRLTLNRTLGTAKLAVRVPGPGRLVLAKTAQVRRYVRRATRAGIVRLIVRARGRALQRLNRTGRVTVRTRVTYTPTGGTRRTKTKRVTLLRR